MSLVVLLSLAWLAGCAVTPPAASQATSPATATPSPVSTATPTPSRTKPAGPTLPTAEDALDVGSFDNVHFASPTGRIWCAMSADWTLCHFPKGMNMAKVPKPSSVCPGSGLDVTGVSVGTTAEYFCSGGTEALPQTNGLNVDWWKSTGFGSVKYDGQKLAILPYGKKLLHSPFVCESAEAGISCGNVDSRKGFRVSAKGVEFLKK